MDDQQIAQQEEILRAELRRLGLGWILEQVDEALVNEATEDEEPPTAMRRVEVLVDAVAFGIELSERTEESLFPLLAGESLSPMDAPVSDDVILPDVQAIRFVDPVAREETREVSRDRGDRATRARAVLEAGERFKMEIRS